MFVHTPTLHCTTPHPHRTVPHYTALYCTVSCNLAVKKTQFGGRRFLSFVFGLRLVPLPLRPIMTDKSMIILPSEPDSLCAAVGCSGLQFVVPMSCTPVSCTYGLHVSLVVGGVGYCAVPIPTPLVFIPCFLSLVMSDAWESAACIHDGIVLILRLWSVGVGATVSVAGGVLWLQAVWLLS